MNRFLIATVRPAMSQWCNHSLRARVASVLAVALLVSTPTSQAFAQPDAAEETSTALQGELLAPRAFRQAAASIEPMLVRIETFGGVDSGQQLGPGAPLRPGEGPTTGLVISSDGLIITSTFNFLQDPPIITVVMPDGERRVAELLGRDPRREVCLLKVNDVADLPVPEIAPLDEIQIGQWALSVGLGFGGERPTISAGAISGLHRIGGYAVQSDASMSPVCYGGPLLDIEGRVIGICVPLSPPNMPGEGGATWYDSGIGFAVPLDGLAKAIESMAAGEDVQQGLLGIQPTSDPRRCGKAAIIESVSAGSAAQEAGLEDGDKIVSIDGTPILGPVHLRHIMTRYFAGDEIEMSVTRGDENLEMTVTLDGP